MTRRDHGVQLRDDGNLAKRRARSAERMAEAGCWSTAEPDLIYASVGRLQNARDERDTTFRVIGR